MSGIFWEVAAGAFAGSFLGYVSQWLYDKRERRHLRRKLGSTLRAAIHVIGDPISYRGESNSVHLLNLPPLNNLLDQGLIHPRWEDDLLDLLVHFQTVLQRFNHSAELYNQACLNGLAENDITGYWHDLNGASWDLQECIKNVDYIGDRLGELPSILEPQTDISAWYAKRKLTRGQKIIRSIELW